MPPPDRNQTRGTADPGTGNRGTNGSAAAPQQTPTKPKKKLYDRAAAVAYAAKFWDEVCSDNRLAMNYQPFYITLAPGTSLTDEASRTLQAGANDCAHYVSCCIGREKNHKGGGLAVPTELAGGVYGYVSTPKLHEWLTGAGYRIAQGNDLPDKMKPGDVIIYRKYLEDAKGNKTKVLARYHAGLYVGDGSVSSHTASRRAEPWDSLGAVTHDFFHLPD